MVDAASLKSALAGCDAVIYAASSSSYWAPEAVDYKVQGCHMYDTNHQCTFPSLQLVNITGCRQRCRRSQAVGNTACCAYQLLPGHTCSTVCWRIFRVHTCVCVYILVLSHVTHTRTHAPLTSSLHTTVGILCVFCSTTFDTASWTTNSKVWLNIFAHEGLGVWVGFYVWCIPCATYT